MAANNIWWEGLIACPSCGAEIATEHEKLPSSSCSCGLQWSRCENIIEWKSEQDKGQERIFPAEWIERSKAKGIKRLSYLANRLLWNVMKIMAFPFRFLLQYRLSSFHKRSITDEALAKHWQQHYLKGLPLPSQPLIYEYSYRKVEKAGFAQLLGHKIVIQDIREHFWWKKFPNALFQIVPAELNLLPFHENQVDVVFTDGVIFDMEALQLQKFLEECHRVIRPGGSLVIWGGNSLSKSRSKSEIQWHGRIHSADVVREMAGNANFREKELSFEGFSPTIFPRLINTLRKILAPWPFKSYDSDSWLARFQQPEKRDYWLLKLQKEDCAS